MPGKVVGPLLERFTTWLFPAVLVVLVGITLLWQLSHTEQAHGRPILLRVWEETEPVNTEVLAPVLERLQAQPQLTSIETQLSRNPFWFSLHVPGAVAGPAMDLDFPSRHASTLACWNASTGQSLGEINRERSTGAKIGRAHV